MLIFMVLIYLVLMFVLLEIFARIIADQRERRQRQLPRQPLVIEERNATQFTLWSFIFLEFTLFFRLLTCTLILIYVMGLESQESGMPVFYLRIFYYLSVVFFYVSVSLGIY